VHDHTADTGAEHAALGLDVEHPLVIRGGGRDDPADLGGVLAQVLTLGADGDGRCDVQVVEDPLVAGLGVDGHLAALQRVEPDDALGEDGAVGRDRVALAALEPIAGVVARKERTVHLGRGVQHERRDLLVAGLGVQLLAQPAPQAVVRLEEQLADGAFGVEPRGTLPGGRLAQEAARPKLTDARPEDRVVVRELDAHAVAADVPVRGKQTEQLGSLLGERGPLQRTGEALAQCDAVAGPERVRANLLVLGVQHLVVGRGLDDAAARLDAQQHVVRIGPAPPGRRDGGDRRPSVTVPDVHERPGVEALHARSLAKQRDEIRRGPDARDAVLPHHQRRAAAQALVVEKYPRRRVQVVGLTVIHRDEVTVGLGHAIR
jgi:hypothetical protein